MDFWVDGSFIVGQSAAHAVNPVPFPCPQSFDDSPVSAFAKQYFENPQQISAVFEQVYADHISAHEDLYLTSRKVTVIPQKAIQMSVRERVQLVRSLLSHVFTSKIAILASQNNFKLAFTLIGQCGLFVLHSALIHFQKLSSSGEVYKTEEIRSKFIRAVLDFFVPCDIRCFCLQSIPVKLISGDIPLAKDSLLLTFWSDSRVECIDSESSKVVSLHMGSECKLTATTIELLNDASAKLSFKFDESIFNKNAPIERFWPTIHSTTASILSCFNSLQPSSQVSTSCLARSLCSLDNTFIISFFDVLGTIDSKQVIPIFNSMLTLHAYCGTQMQLMKFICYYETQRITDTNELFRQNNNFIRCVLTFFNRVGDEYKKTTIKRLYQKISEYQNWSLDHPTEGDIKIANELLVMFWDTLDNEISNIPGSIRCICRYLRLLSEVRFHQSILIHRSLFAVFLLRFVFVALSSPQDLGLPLDPKGLTRVIQLTKLLAHAGQLQYITNEKSSDRIKLNPVIEANFGRAIDFYEKLCSPCPPSDFTVTKREASDAAAMIKGFFVQHGSEIADGINKPRDSSFPHIFVDELIGEFLSAPQNKLF